MPEMIRALGSNVMRGAAGFAKAGIIAAPCADVRRACTVLTVATVPPVTTVAVTMIATAAFAFASVMSLSAPLANGDAITLPVAAAADALAAARCAGA